MLALVELAGKRRGWLVALFAACAFESRFSMIGALPVYAYLLADPRPHRAARIRLVLRRPCRRRGALGALQSRALGNVERHRVHDVVSPRRGRHADRLAVSFEYLPYQLGRSSSSCRRLTGSFPWLRPEYSGVALTWTSPALVLAFSRARRVRWAIALWAAALLTAIPNFLYYVNGFAQFGMRHALDFEPFLVALMMLAARDRLAVVGARADRLLDCRSVSGAPGIGWPSFVPRNFSIAIRKACARSERYACFAWGQNRLRLHRVENVKLLLRKLGAEAAGTFMITATAISVDVLHFSGRGVEDVSRWLARGLITTAVVYAFAQTSGAHANPVVTIAFSLRGVFPRRLSIAYIVAQFAGALAASLLLWALFGSQLALGASRPGPGFTPLAATFCEVALTFAFTMVILMTAQEEAVVGREAAIAVGFVVAACGFAGGGISGASMNPARSLAAQGVAGLLGFSWIYVVGPLVGAVVAVLLHALLAGAPSKGARHAASGRQSLHGKR